jgi:hypothetical protein
MLCPVILFFYKLNHPFLSRIRNVLTPQIAGHKLKSKVYLSGFLFYSIIRNAYHEIFFTENSNQHIDKNIRTGPDRMSELAHTL